MDQVDGDARAEHRIFDHAHQLGELGPRDVERLHVLEAAGTQHALLDALPADREQRQEALRIASRQRRDRLIARARLHRSGGNTAASSPTCSREWSAWYAATCPAVTRPHSLWMSGRSRVPGAWRYATIRWCSRSNRFARSIGSASES